MACSCSPSMKRVYYSNIQLYPELKDGLVSGGSPNLSTKEITVCTECGNAEFMISEDERRWFRA